jgi:hypothetical protein
MDAGGGSVGGAHVTIFTARIANGVTGSDVEAVSTAAVTTGNV